MSENLGLGKLITTKQYRDAIHIAVVPVVSAMHGYSLMPGEPLRLDHIDADGTVHVTSSLRGEGIGIVDPFLNQAAHHGEQFWMWLTPGSITSLRHAWTHPALPDEGERLPTPLQIDAEAKLTEVAESLDVSYVELIQMCRNRSLVVGHDIMTREVPDDFWDWYETVSGDRVKGSEREPYFSCSC
jgi:hypothetical protein